MSSTDTELIIKARDLTGAAFQAVHGQLRETGKLADQCGASGARSFGLFAGSLRQFDDVLQVAGGPNLRDLIQGVDQLGDVANGTSGQLGLLAKAGLVASAAMGGWNIGRKLAELTGSDSLIGSATAKLMGWGDAAAQAAGAGADVLARASKNAGRQITDMTEAIRINEAATKQSIETITRSNAPAQSAAMVAAWRGELDKLRSTGVLDNLRKDLESQSFSQQDLAARYGVSTAALQLFTRETGEQQKALVKTTQAAEQHAAHIKSLGESYAGSGVLQAIADMNEALAKEGLSLRALSVDALVKLNKTVQDGSDYYRTRGEVAPRALQIETLAIKAALEAARRAEAEYQKMHGPIGTFSSGKTGIDLGAIPFATNFEDTTWATRSTLIGRGLTEVFKNGAAQIDADAVAAAARKRLKDALGKTLGEELVEGIKGSLSKMPDILMSAFTGGGGLAGGMKAIGVSIANDIAKGISSSKEVAATLTKLAGAISAGTAGSTLIGGAAGGGTGAQIAGLASSLGGVALSASHAGTAMAAAGVAGSIGMAAATMGIGLAATGAVMLIKHFTDHKGRDAIKAFAAEFKGGFDGPDGMHAALLKAGDAGEAMWKRLSGIGTRDAAGAAAAIADARALISKAAADEAEKNAIPALNEMQAAIERYGGTLDDLGPKVQAMRVTEVATSILADFKLIEKGTGDLTGIYNKSQDEVIELLNKARATGAALPATLKPFLQEMENAGLLTAAAGNELEGLSGVTFAEELADKIGGLMDSMKELVGVIRDGVGGALGDLGRTRIQPIRVPYYYDEAGGGDSSAPPEHARGAYIRQDHVARVHAGEIIGPADFMTRALVQALQVTGGGGGNNFAVSDVHMDGRKVGELVVRRIPAAVRRFGKVHA
jgi:hypothetical protein